MNNNEFMSLEKTQVLLLYILKYINEITEKNNIPYFSHGGTTLGAIRHKGFIPWDDDIDLIMERKYYDTFVSACEEYLPENLTIRTRENDPYFCEEYIKVCYVDEVSEYSELAVDIFILDETNPKRKIFRWWQNFIIKSIRPIKLYKATRKAEYLEKYVPNNLLKRLLISVLSIIPLNTLTSIQTKTMLGEKKKTDYLVDWGSISHYTRATWKKDWFSKRVKLAFENMYVWASEHYTDILIRGYGETYMQLPPIEKRKTHAVHEIKNKDLDFEEIKKIVES